MPYLPRYVRVSFAARPGAAGDREARVALEAYGSCRSDVLTNSVVYGPDPAWFVCVLSCLITLPHPVRSEHRVQWPLREQGATAQETRGGVARQVETRLCLGSVVEGLGLGTG